MRSAEVYFKSELAGVITENDNGGYTFKYLDLWVANEKKAPISLTLPKTTEAYTSGILFPFFYHLLPEGTNKQMVCESLKIDKDDFFSLLVATAQIDTIGAVTIKEIT